MQRPTEKFIVISLLVISLCIFPIYLKASENAGDGLPASQVQGEPEQVQILPVSTPLRTTSYPDLESQPKIYELIFGINMVLIGFLAVALALYRRKSIDLSLISFGVFCIIWGARTNTFQYLLNGPLIYWAYGRWALTYMTPVPVWIFFEQIIGRGWKSSIRRLLQLQIAFAIVAISVDLWWRLPGKAMVANNVMAILGILVVFANILHPGLAMTRELKVLKYGGAVWAIFALYENVAPLLTPGYRIVSLEAYGFVIFLGCLIYVVAYRFSQNEKELITLSHELETARQIQSFILPQETVNIKGLNLATQYVPMAAVAGDFYDFIKLDDKRLGVLVADVSGHGVPASLISSMVKIAFTSQLPHAHDPARVLAGINQILCGKLENDFVTAGYLFIDTEDRVATYAGAGHPPLLVWRGSEEKIYEYRQKSIVLGQFEDALYQNSELSLESGDRFILYTDGITEANNAAGEFFGESRFKGYITSRAHRPIGDFTDGFIRHIINWSVKHSDDALDDDLTLVVADYKSS